MIVGDNETKNLIFDIVINTECKNILSDDEIIDNISSSIKKSYPNYNCIITLDKHYL